MNTHARTFYYSLTSMMLIVSLLTAGCTQDSSEPAASHTSSHMASSSTVETAEPANVDKDPLLLQQPQWVDCESFVNEPDYVHDQSRVQAIYGASVLCTYVEVPVVHRALRADDEQRGIPHTSELSTAKLAVAKVPSVEPSHGVIFFNPGGPGGSGVYSVGALSAAIRNAGLNQFHDVVSFDPRTVGMSFPRIQCVSHQVRDLMRIVDTRQRDEQSVTNVEDQTRAYAQGCLESVGEEFFAHAGTRDTAHDLDYLRQILTRGLREEKQGLRYFGFSYGTKLGAFYAKYFPYSIQALVLDGAIDSTRDTSENVAGQSSGFQAMFEEFAAWCLTQADCPFVPQQIPPREDFAQLLEVYAGEPIPFGDRAIGVDDMEIATFASLYNQSMWHDLKRGIIELAAGKPQVFAGISDSYVGRQADGRYDNSTDAFNMIRCSDDPTRFTREQAGELEMSRRELAPMFDYGPVADIGPRDLCTFWPVPASADHEPDTALQSGMAAVISTTLDPSTPYEDGVSLARQLGVPLLTYNGKQHTVFLEGNGCVDQPIVALLRDSVPLSSDIEC